MCCHRYKTPTAVSPRAEALCWIFQENKYIFKIPSWFSFSFGLFVLLFYLWLICYQLDSYLSQCICVLPFTLFFCAVIVLNSSYFGHIQIILSQSRCSLEPKNFLMGASPLKPPLRGSEHPRLPQPPSSVDSHYACFSADYVYSWNDVCLITIVGFKLKILRKTIWIFKTNYNFKQESYFQ